MKSNCELCGSKYRVGRHHRFPQTKWARRLYGELLDNPKNIMRACVNCHASHASTELTHWSEKEFCEALGIEPRSKTERGKA